MPWTAAAVGLGRLVVLSAMGEPFRAEIELLSYQDEWAILTPRLLPPNRYPLTGFRYNPALDGVRLTIRKYPNGRHTIDVAAVRPVNEPFIYLLVEIEANGARIVRGYTALLNPNGYGEPPPDHLILESTPAAVIGVSRAIISAPVPATSLASIAPVPMHAAVPAERNVTVDRKLLDAKVDDNAKTLAGLLERVTALELAVEDLQRRQTIQEAVAAAQMPAAVALTRKGATAESAPDTGAATAAAGPKSSAAAPTPPKLPPDSVSAKGDIAPGRSRSWTETILNEALPVFAGSLLILTIVLIYWIWGRPPLKEEPPEGGE